MSRVAMNMGHKLKLGVFATLATTFALAPAAGAAEPNNDFATATGPLTAGQPFKASLETADDSDFQFFYIPDTATVTVTVTNNTPQKDATGGRTILASVLQARKGKLPLPLADTQRKIAPTDKGKIKLTLVPGKYFVPIGHASTTNPAADVPFTIQINPAGTTTDSYELFARRCNDAHRMVERTKQSKKNIAERLKKAKKNDASYNKVSKLAVKLREKRAKVKEAQRIKRIVCSVPQ
jgi:hypothetical protein